MSAVGEPGSPSRLPSHKFTPYSNAQTNMYDYPAQFTTAQLEAKAILAHLLKKIKQKDSRYYSRYGKWAERHPRLDEFCFRCVRPHVWTFLNGRWSLDALKNIQGDLKFEGRGVYLDGVLGLDKRVRIYIGQAASIRQRIAQHLNFRYRRDNHSLHYHAMQQSVYNAIGLIAFLPSPNMGGNALPGMDSPDLLLNLIEMWMCLVFRTLPPQLQEEWLPDDGTVNKSKKDGKEGEYGGLNIASPLDHAEKEREWLDLSEIEDPLIRDYLGLGRQLSEAEQRKRSEVQYLKPEIKQEEETHEDTPAQRRKQYIQRTKSYNQYVREKGEQNPQAVASIFVFGVAVVLGIMIIRSNGGPRR